MESSTDPEEVKDLERCRLRWACASLERIPGWPAFDEPAWERFVRKTWACPVRSVAALALWCLRGERQVDPFASVAEQARALILEAGEPAPLWLPSFNAALRVELTIGFAYQKDLRLFFARYGIDQPFPPAEGILGERPDV